MSWLLNLDVGLFRFLNGRLAHPFLDVVVPWFSGNAVFAPALVALAVLLVWKGGIRGRVFVLVLAATIALGDGLIINTLKHALQRPRPFAALADVHLLAGRGKSYGMPSSHASTWFAATLIAFIYYRRSLRFMLPLACLVGFSRVYVGVHYPSDVLVGALLGAGYAAAALVALQWGWSALGPRCFPVWHQRLPNLTSPQLRPAPAPAGAATDTTTASEAADRQWHWLAYGFIALVFVLRLTYLATPTINLSEDEAYQWTWSKHLALSYFSKPPMIAYLQWLGTQVWGDTPLGVRFMSPVIAAILGLVLFRFAAPSFGVRPAFVLLVLAAVTPLLTVGSTLLTVDPPLVLFWTCSMVVGWRALQPGGTTGHWLLAGLCTGLAFLSKYSALYQILCYACFFGLWKPARAQLRQRGPWLALLVVGLCTLPVLIWNATHGWITVHHVATNAGLHRTWTPTLRFLGEFLAAEAVLLNPILLVAAAWAAVGIWRERERDPLRLFLFCMGVPVFAGHVLYALHSRVQPNWIAPSIIPLLLLTVGYWAPRWGRGGPALPRWLTAAFVINALLVALLHDTRILGKLTGRQLPLELDPLRRARGWTETAQLVEDARRGLEAEGRPAFVIAGHYGMVGELSFYLPEARRLVATRPLVYHRTTERPGNQYFFWPGYVSQRPGENALYVRELDARRRPVSDLWAGFLEGRLSVGDPKGAEEPLSVSLQREFESITELGVHPVRYRNHTIRWVQLFACRGLRATPEPQRD